MGILLVGGGMGEVFRARETPRNRHMVVKVLPKARTNNMDAGELKDQRVPHATRLDAAIPPEWLAEFEAAARRPLETRFRYAFIHTYKPVLDDAPFRAFDTTADYRRWCEEHLPEWLGYGRV